MKRLLIFAALLCPTPALAQGDARIAGVVRRPTPTGSYWRPTSLTPATDPSITITSVNTGMGSYPQSTRTDEHGCYDFHVLPGQYVVSCAGTNTTIRATDRETATVWWVCASAGHASLDLAAPFADTDLLWRPVTPEIGLSPIEVTHAEVLGYEPQVNQGKGNGFVWRVSSGNIAEDDRFDFCALVTNRGQLSIEGLRFEAWFDSPETSLRAPLIWVGSLPPGQSCPINLSVNFTPYLHSAAHVRLTGLKFIDEANWKSLSRTDAAAQALCPLVDRNRSTSGSNAPHRRHVHPWTASASRPRILPASAGRSLDET